MDVIKSNRHFVASLVVDAHIGGLNAFDRAHREEPVLENALRPENGTNGEEHDSEPDEREDDYESAAPTEWACPVSLNRTCFRIVCEVRNLHRAVFCGAGPGTIRGARVLSSIVGSKREVELKDVSFVFRHAGLGSLFDPPAGGEGRGGLEADIVDDSPREEDHDKRHTEAAEKEAEEDHGQACLL